ncbi:MAG: SH3 domain-containing protein [Chloroflexi bacterium]|nr:SH3 domain-containing protein [Chloroflexota bacterium]
MPIPTGTASPSTPSPAPSETPTVTPTAQPTVCTVTATALHIRQGAGVEYAVIGWLTRGESVSVQNQRGAWYDIGAGWIHSKYCEVKP